VSEPALTSGGGFEPLHLQDLCTGNTGDDHLGNAITPLDAEGGLAPVDEDQANLAPVSESMVPGELTIPTPCFNANPLLGRIWAS